MTRYYFDLQDNDETTIDEEGVELASLQRVREEAGRSLALGARRGHQSRDEPPHELAISVRDDRGPVLKVRFTFERLRV